MSREAFGDPPEGHEPPQTCPVCGEEWHTEGCESDWPAIKQTLCMYVETLP